MPHIHNDPWEYFCGFYRNIYINNIKSEESINKNLLSKETEIFPNSYFIDTAELF